LNAEDAEVFKFAEGFRISFCAFCVTFAASAL
jgi:hypothetical protein